MKLDPNHDATNIIHRVESAARRKRLPSVEREWIMRAIRRLEFRGRLRQVPIKVKPLKLFQLATELEAAAATKQ